MTSFPLVMMPLFCLWLTGPSCVVWNRTEMSLFIKRYRTTMFLVSFKWQWCQPLCCGSSDCSPFFLTSLAVSVMFESMPQINYCDPSPEAIPIFIYFRGQTNKNNNNIFNHRLTQNTDIQKKSIYTKQYSFRAFIRIA